MPNPPVDQAVPSSDDEKKQMPVEALWEKITLPLRSVPKAYVLKQVNLFKVKDKEGGIELKDSSEEPQFTNCRPIFKKANGDYIGLAVQQLMFPKMRAQKDKGVAISTHSVKDYKWFSFNPATSNTQYKKLLEISPAESKFIRLATPIESIDTETMLLNQLALYYQAKLKTVPLSIPDYSSEDEQKVASRKSCTVM